LGVENFFLEILRKGSSGTEVTAAKLPLFSHWRQSRVIEINSLKFT